MEENKSANFGYPRHDIAPRKKNKNWHLQYSKAFHKEFKQGDGKILRWAKKDYDEWRLIARGKQPTDQYREKLSKQKRKGKSDKTWKNIDWSILPIFPRFKTVMINRLLKQPRERIIQAIDQTSLGKEKKREATMLAYVANKDFFDSTAQDLGIPSDSPFEPGEPVPENKNEIKMHLQMYPKNEYIMFMSDQIDLTLLNNDWKQIEEELLDDAIDIGVFGTHVWLDTNGAIRINRVIPERMISNAIEKKDFSDMIRFGNYEMITISQLRSQVEKGTFKEEDYAKIAAQATGNSDYASAAGSSKYFELHNCYPYDHERITILRWECFSADDNAFVVVKKDGNIDIQNRDNPGWLNETSDDEYAQFWQTKGENRKVVRDSSNNLYGCTWIVDTEYVYNHGRINNMLRTISNLKDVESGYTMYTFDWDSLTRQCSPIVHNIQTNWLQYQHHIASSKPQGLAIEKRALGLVDLGGGVKLTSGQMLQMYAETGSYVYIGTDQHGRPYPFEPIKELKGGISDAAKQHLEFIIADIDLLRGILGLNEATDASSVDPKLGKAVSEMVNLNTNNALGTIYHGFTSVVERTLNKIAMLVPDANEIPNKARTESLGEANQAFIKLFKDLPFMQFGIKIEVGVTDDLRARLSGHIDSALKSNGGVLLPEDAYLIENEPNIQRAYMLLAQKRRQREEQMMNEEIAKMNAQAEGNTQTAVALEQEKRKTAEEEVKLYREKKGIDTESELLKIREKAQWELIGKKIDAGITLTIEEQKLMADMVKTEAKLSADIIKAKITAKSKEKPLQTKK